MVECGEVVEELRGEASSPAYTVQIMVNCPFKSTLSWVMHYKIMERYTFLAQNFWMYPGELR